MQLRVLGPVEASTDDGALPLGGAKPRSVLAMLGLQANRTVPADHLIEGLWGERPPTSAAKMLQNYVWRLRTALGEDAGIEIVTRGRGYELRIDEDAVDARRFERLLAEANRAAAAGEPADAARHALALWRGPALADVADEPFAADEIRRLEDLRVEAAELAVDADLAAGRHHELTAEIDALIAAHPLREHLHAQRMLALYRCGRQAEALAAYTAARRLLVEEIGVEPGPELKGLHEAILRHDPSLDVKLARPELPRGLDARGGPPLEGRARELAWLRGHWQRAVEGAGALVAVTGMSGMGKTRLVAELAGEAHDAGATVVYRSGADPRPAHLPAAAGAQATLLVVDDADATVVDALGEPAAEAALLVVVTGTEALGAHDALTLGPLDAAAVRAIAVRHTPERLRDDLPVDRLLRESGGVPRRVREATTRWARSEAARRVDAGAGRAATGRAELRSAEAELAGDVAVLREAREELDAEPGADGRQVCPYKGLASFQGADARYFFGRERLVAELVARLVGAPLLGVVGPSGSGKSSVVRAGLLPALAGGALPGSEAWVQVLIRPGAHPLRELGRATAGIADDARVLLAVDQFEETFTACTDEAERAAFISELAGARRPDGRVVVLAVRADHYGRCAAYPDLSALLAVNHVLVGPMRRDELRRAIEHPARRAGLEVERDLSDALVADVVPEPGALPMLSTALLELWQHRDGRRLRLSGYADTGGVRGAVARLAEDAYGGLTPAQQRIARTTLLRLVDDGRPGAVERRRVPRAALETDAAVGEVVEVLAERRLLTVTADGVEVAHEALLHEWPRLRSWLEQDAEVRRVHRRLARAAGDWEAEGRDDGLLYRGARLAAALEWRAGHATELSGSEAAFLDASRAAGDRAHRRLRLALAGVSALLALAVVAAVVALDQRGTARARALTADAQRLGAEALAEDGLDRALLLARQAVALEDSPVTRDNLLSVLLRSPAAIGVLPRIGAQPGILDLRPDGRALAVATDDSRVVFVDPVARRRLGRPYGSHGRWPVLALSFSPDGARLAVARDAGDSPYIDVVDARTRRILRQVRHSSLASVPMRLAFSRDGRVLVAGPDVAPRGQPFEVARWDVRTGRELARAIVHDAHGRTLGFLQQGRRLLTATAGGITIRDTSTLRPVHRLAGAPDVARLSPDERVLALWAADGSLRFLDLETRRVTVAEGGHQGRVSAARFSPDGRRLVSAGRDGRLILWNVEHAAIVETLEDRLSGAVRGIAITRYGATAYTTSSDGSVLGWDLAGERRLARPLPASERRVVRGPLTVTARGVVAIPDEQGFVEVVDTRASRVIRRLEVGGRGSVAAAAVTPDGRTAAAVTTRGEVGFWDVRSGRRMGPLWPAHSGTDDVRLAFSADGRRLVTSADDLLRVWDVRRRVTANSLLHSDNVDMSLTRDGRRLAVVRAPNNIFTKLDVFAVPSLRLVRQPRVPPGTVGRFSADGRTLVYGDAQGRVWFYDTRSWTPRGEPLAGPTVPVESADLSPDGRLLAVTWTDGTARLWDVAARRPIGGAAINTGGNWITAAFAGDGRRVLFATALGGTVWDVRPAAWERHACAVAGRALTRAEWRAALPGRDYAPACGPAVTP